MIKRLIYILVLIIILSTPAIAQTQNGYLQYNGYQYSFKPGEKSLFIQKADNNMILWEKAKSPVDKKFYLQEAMRYYFLVSQADKTSLDAQIGLGRICDEMKLDARAKKHFFVAYNMNNKDPRVNFYFANYYFKRNELITALTYYQASYNSGFSNNFYLNYQLGNIYEKLADIESAKKHYIKANKLNPKSIELTNKIRLLDELNYSGSQYYLFRK